LLFSPEAGYLWWVKKISHFIFSLIALAAIVAVPGTQRTGSNEREAYDQFLHAQYCKLPETLSEHSPEGNEASCPDLAAIRDYFMTIDPVLKRVPVERLRDAVAYRQNLVQDKSQAGSPDSKGWTEVGSDMGGRCRSVFWDPNDPAHRKVWAASVTGGLRFNNDITSDTTPWLPADDLFENLVISTITFDPCNPQVFYLGTGEPFTAVTIYRESSGVGSGIWKSTDAGCTWDWLSSTSDFRYISQIRVRNENGNGVVYAGVLSGVYHGSIIQSYPSDGLYRSADGGETWQQVLPDIPGENEPFSPSDIEISANGRIYIGTMPNITGDGGAVILSSYSGLEDSWTTYDNYVNIIENDPEFYLPGRVEISIAPSNPSRMYACIGAGYTTSQGFDFYRGKHIIRSNSQGNTWTSLPIPDNDPMWALIVWHSIATAVDPNNPDRVYIGGRDVWRSTNGGNNWTRLSDWEKMYTGGGNDYIHCDQHMQLYREGSSDTLLFATDGGIFYTENAANPVPVFQERNKNFSTLQFYTCDIYPVAGVNYFVGGLQDNATLLYHGEPLNVNDMIYISDGAYCFFDSDEPSIMVVSTMYNEYGLFINFNHVGDFGDGSGVFINPADYDSHNNILYANAGQFNGNDANTLLRVTGIPEDPDPDWIYINSGLNTYYSSILVSPYSPDGSTTLYLGSQNGRVFRVINAQANPQLTELTQTILPTAYISCITLAGSEDTILVTFSNYGEQKIFQTTDGGESWDDRTGNIPDMPVRWAVYHPEISGVVMIATEMGVWTTEDINNTNVFWEPDSHLPNVRVDMLKIRKEDKLLLAATHGRGLFYKTWDFIQVGTKEESECMAAVYPNPGNGTFHLSFHSQEANQELNLTITDLNGRTICEKVYSAQPGDNTFTLDLSSFPEGIYLVMTRSGTNRYATKIVNQKGQ
jgi:photosystem II stability/assembly factor-like uncharacterized protein